MGFRLIAVVALWCLLFAAHVSGAEAKLGWTKLELVYAEDRKPAPPHDVLRAFGAELVADYESFAVAYCPERAIAGLTRAVQAKGWIVHRRDDYDILRLPGADVDTRDANGNAAESGVVREYVAGPGLFVIQFTAPPRREWVAELQSKGWLLARYVPNNAFIAIGESVLRGSTKNLPFVQYVELFQPFQKNAFPARDGTVRALVFDLPTGPPLDETIEAITVQAAGPIAIHRGAKDTLVYASMSDRSAQVLLRQQLIIGVGPELTAHLADERQVMSLTSQLEFDGTALHPALGSRMKYWDWIGDKCPECATMPHTTWQVSVADTGLYKGLEGDTHPDLRGRVKNGLLDTQDLPPDCLGHCDWAGHGTIVAGIIAGDNALGSRDRLQVGTGNDDDPENLGWYLGTGVARTAGILVTKISRSSFFPINEAKITKWIADTAIDPQGRARTPRVTIQNHSFEARGPGYSPGFYSHLARAYDLVVRDANESYSGRPEVLVAVAAGNATDGTHHVSAGAMAKNVLTVSGVESWRTYPDREGCDPGGDGFRNIMRISRMGTKISGYIKPDVMAPATRIVSLNTANREETELKFCPKRVRGYYDADPNDENKTEYGAVQAGTSYAAPVGAGAALIVKRYLAAAPELTSPALTKAMLITGARSIRGGVDYTSHPDFPGTTISSVPSEQQGFGRLSFEDILNGAEKPIVVTDQERGVIFEQTGQVKTARFRVRKSTRPVRVVLTWTDAAGTPNDTNPNVSALVNDLDLEVRPDGAELVFVGNRLSANEESIGFPIGTPGTPDRVNNVEIAHFTLAASQEFEVRVRANRIAGDTDGYDKTFEQDWAMVIVNAETVTPVLPYFLPTAMAAPANLQAISGAATVSLTWSGVSGVTDYLVQRQTGVSEWQDVLPYVAGTAASDTPASENRVVSYRVVAIGQSGHSTPSNTVTTCLAPAVVSLTKSAEWAYGRTGSITVAANGPNLTYQWYRGQSNDISHPIATASGTDTTVSFTLQYTDYYWVRVTSTCMDGSQRFTDSAAVFYSVAPRITTQPAWTSIPSGGRTLLSVGASGTYLSYQWYETTGYSSTLVAGATSASYLTPEATTLKKYWVRVTSGVDAAANSNVAEVSICSGPTINSFTSSGSGDDFSFTVVVPSSQRSIVTYHWYSGTRGVPSQSVDRGIGDDLRTFFNITPLPATFWVRVAFTNGSCYQDTLGRTVP